MLSKGTLFKITSCWNKKNNCLKVFMAFKMATDLNTNPPTSTEDKLPLKTRDCPKKLENWWLKQFKTQSRRYGFFETWEIMVDNLTQGFKQGFHPRKNTVIYHFNWQHRALIHPMGWKQRFAINLRPRSGSKSKDMPVTLVSERASWRLKVFIGSNMEVAGIVNEQSQCGNTA